MNLQLRPEQQQVIDDIAAAFRAGHKRVMVSAPCGFGKTELATAILQATKGNQRRGAFLADRISLVNQTSERFDKYGLDHGIMMAQHWRFRPSEQIQICSVQTLQRRRWPDVNLIVVDEAHVLHGAIRTKLEQKDCFAIGLSATAVTPGLGKYFDSVVNAPPTNRLIEKGLLTPYRIFSCAEPNMTGVKVGHDGEWDDKETEKKALEVVGDVVEEYVKNGGNKKFIGFGATIAHCQELQRQFLAAGINVALYTSEEKDDERIEVVREFRKPDSLIRGLLSVEALTRGFDVADVEVLILARPLRKALAVHIQMMGRVMRTSDGKTEALILDHSGNCSRFWHEMNELFEYGVRKLDDGKRKEKPKPDEKPDLDPIKCPNCGHLHLPRPTCPHCGHEYPKRQSVQHVPGTLKEILKDGTARQKTEALWPQIARYAIDRRGGKNDAAKKLALALFMKITGAFPQANWDRTTPALQVSPEVASRIRAENIRFSKGRKKAATQNQAVSA